MTDEDILEALEVLDEDAGHAGGGRARQAGTWGAKVNAEQRPFDILDVELVNVGDIQASTYNPREVKPERLDLVRLSLAKFGFLLPIYCDVTGEILSGHQRHFVATEMLGATKVPIVRTRRALNERMRRSLNLVFNRATNDLRGAQNSESITAALINSDVPGRAAELPDIPVDSDDWFPVLRATEEPAAEILDANPLWSDPHGLDMARRLDMIGNVGIMPIVCTPSNRIVNGAARVAAAAAAGTPLIPVVRVPEEQFDVAFGLLNLLSMRYAVEGTYREALRSNAFKAAPHVRHSMSYGTTFDLTGSKQANMFNHQDPAHARAWVNHYGTKLVDFGGGKLWDARHIEEMGRVVGEDVTCAVFEPWFMMDLEKARAVGRRFLSFVANPDWVPQSMFMNNVMNSVPFQEDREAIVLLCAALADGQTVQFSTGRGTDDAGLPDESTERLNAQAQAAAGRVAVDYEPRVSVAMMASNPMMQKFHTEDEFADLYSTAWQRVRSAAPSNRVQVVCTKPRPIDPAKLRAAIELEFGMDWPDDQGTLGLVTLAKRAYATRLGMPEILEPGPEADNPSELDIHPDPEPQDLIDLL